jgi:hypothetical protein
VQHFEVQIDDLAHPGAQYLDHDLLAVLESGCVNLGDRSRGERRLLETAEDGVEREPEGLFDGCRRDAAVEGRDTVLQFRQLIRNIGGQQKIGPSSSSASRSRSPRVIPTLR